MTHEKMIIKNVKLKQMSVIKNLKLLYINIGALIIEWIMCFILKILLLRGTFTYNPM